MIWSRVELLRQGMSDFEVRRQVRNGALLRLAPDAYIRADAAGEWPEDRFRWRVLAHGRRTDLVAGGVSAAVMHRLPVPAADLSSVHFISQARSGNRAPGSRRVSTFRLSENDVTTVDGIRVTSVARSLVDVARTQPRLTAVAAADFALQQGACDPVALGDALLAATGLARIEQARSVLALADGRCESPGETWARMLLQDAALPPCELQISVYDTAGRFLARVDGGWPERGVLWEYDGDGKYELLARPGQSTSDVVRAEKRRERGLADLGWLILRLDKHDDRDLPALRRRFHGALASASAPGWMSPRGSYVTARPVTIAPRLGECA